MDDRETEALLARQEAPRPTPLHVRLGAAIPHLVAAGALALVFTDFIGGEFRFTPRARDASAWLAYELMACVYMSVLPLGMILAGLLQALCKRATKKRRADGSLLLLAPFLVLAWSLAPDGAAGWGLLAFLALAFARWVTHRHEASTLQAHARWGGASLLEVGVRGVADSAKRAVRVWSYFTASFLLSAILVLPIEPLLGLEIPSVEKGQAFLFLGMGVVYFLLNGVFELFDLHRRLLGAHGRPARAFAVGSETEASGRSSRAA